MGLVASWGKPKGCNLAGSQDGSVILILVVVGKHFAFLLNPLPLLLNTPPPPHYK